MSSYHSYNNSLAAIAHFWKHCIALLTRRKIGNGFNECMYLNKQRIL